MKRLLTFLLAMSFVASVLSAQNFPSPIGHVNDFAKALNPQTVTQLEKQLRDYKKQTTIEIAILIVPNLQGLEKEDYSERVFKQWGIGVKGVDNGLLILQSINPRKYRIETGYGLEQYLPDATLSAIVAQSFVPYLKQNRFDMAHLQLVNALIAKLGDKSMDVRNQMLAEKKHQDEVASAKMNESIGEFLLWCLYIALAIGFVFLVVYVYQQSAKKARLIADYDNNVRTTYQKYREQLLRAKKVSIYGVDDVLGMLDAIYADALATHRTNKIKGERHFIELMENEVKPVLTKYDEYVKVREFVETSKEIQKTDINIRKAQEAFAELSKYKNGTESLMKIAKGIGKFNTDSLRNQFDDIKHLYQAFAYSKASLSIDSFFKQVNAVDHTCLDVIQTLKSMEDSKKDAPKVFDRCVSKYEAKKSIVKQYGGDIQKIETGISKYKRILDNAKEYDNWINIYNDIQWLAALIEGPIQKREDEIEKERKRVAAVAAAAAAAVAAEESRRRRRREEEESRHRSHDSDSSSGGFSGFSGGSSGGGGVGGDY